MKVTFLCGCTLDGFLVDVIKMSEPNPERPGDYQVLGYRLSSGEELTPLDPNQQHFKATKTGCAIHLVHGEAQTA